MSTEQQTTSATAPQAQPPLNGADTEQEQEQQAQQPTANAPVQTQMTQAQIDAIPDPAVRAQVQSLFDRNKQLAAQVKEKDPTWMELCKYGKGTAGIKVSENGAIQITGTRRAFGGLYIFSKEMFGVIYNPEVMPKIIAWAKEHRAVIAERTAAAEVKRAAEKEAEKNKKK